MSMQSSQAADEATAGNPAYRHRWYALGILFLVSVLNTMDKMLIPALAEPLRLEFDLSDSELGFLIGLVFSVAYGVASIPIGILIDRVNRTRLLACLLIAWSGMTLLSARAGSLFSLALCRMGVAAAESGGNPTSFSLLSDYFPKALLGRAIGIFSANSSVAGFLVFSMAGVIAAEFGWRAAFVVAAVPGFMLGALIFLTLKEPARGSYEPPTGRDAGANPGVTEILQTIAANKALLCVAAGAVFVILGQVGSSAFTATFFVRLHDLSLEQAGVVTGILLGGGAAIGTVTGGFLADRAMKKSPGGGCYFLAAVTLVAVPFGCIAYAAPLVSVAIPCLFVFQVLGTCFYAGTFATVLDLSPLRMRGATVTYITIVLNLGGYGLGPQITGFLSDLFRLAGSAQPLRWALIAIVCMLLVSAFFYCLAARRLERSTTPD